MSNYADTRIKGPCAGKLFYSASWACGRCCHAQGSWDWHVRATRIIVFCLDDLARLVSFWRTSDCHVDFHLAIHATNVTVVYFFNVDQLVLCNRFCTMDADPWIAGSLQEKGISHVVYLVHSNRLESIHAAKEHALVCQESGSCFQYHVILVPQRMKVRWVF